MKAMWTLLAMWTALVIQEQITNRAESATSFASKKQGEITIKKVMDLVLECGTDYGINEHFIATQLFVEKRTKRNVLNPFLQQN
jgi:hypothetical protein